MNVEARVASQPALDLGMFVGGVVVYDQMQFLLRWSLFVNQTQELESLLVAVSFLAGADHFAIGQIERGEKRGGTVPFIIVGLGGDFTLAQGQSGLAAIQRLNLAFLVATEH